MYFSSVVAHLRGRVTFHSARPGVLTSNSVREPPPEFRLESLAAARAESAEDIAWRGREIRSRKAAAHNRYISPAESLRIQGAPAPQPRPGRSGEKSSC